VSDPEIRTISDTARWMAAFRAQETARPDAVFRDPFAQALAGDWDARHATALVERGEHAWPFIARTYLFDRFVTRLVEHGVDLVVNLGAGLDTRPYRMTLPASLRWVEVDVPEILDYKAEMLAAATPVCALERVALDVTNEDARRSLFARLGASAQRVAVISEGLIVYLMPREVAQLAMDLAAASFDYWVTDLASPRALEMMNERVGNIMTDAGAPFLFAPREGPDFFTAHGWTPQEARSMLKAAAKLGRLPLALRMFAMLPETSAAAGDRPWSAVCLLVRTA
jgi:methyltransferase (TIGR00027 family)